MPKIYQYKNTIIQTIQKNRRRINAYILQSQIRRIKVYIMLFLVLSFNFTSVFAIENENICYGTYQIYCDKDPYMYINYNGKMQPNYKYYYVKDDVKYPVYCLNYGLKGAEQYNTGYAVDSNTKITDEKLMMIILNGYPYKSTEELGLNENEAIFATQFAIWCYLGDMDINLVEPISDMNLNLVQKIKEIYNSKERSIEEKDIDIDVISSEQMQERVQNLDYYYKMITLNGKNVDNITITTDDENVQITKINDSKYKVDIPVNCVNSSYNVKLDIKMEAKENIALFGKTTIDDFQNVAVTLKSGFDAKIDKQITFEKYESEIIVNKKDKDTNEPLENVEFEVLDSEDSFIGKYITDKNGKATIKLNNIETLTLKLKEIKPQEGYKIDDIEYEVKISPNEVKSIDILNEKQKGKIEIVKKTKEYNKYTNLSENIPLENVEFDILDTNNTVVDSIKTNEYGYAITKELPIGKYYIKETKTNEYYQLLEEKIEVEISEDGQVCNVQVLNDNVYIDEKLPVTGR